MVDLVGLSPIISTAKPLLDKVVAGRSMSDGGEPSAADYLLPVVAAIIISNVATKVINEIVLPSRKEEEMVEGMYKRIEEKIKSSNLPLKNEEEVIIPKDVEEVDKLIEESIKSLEDAKIHLAKASEKSSCGVCKTTLSKLKKSLDEESKEVLENTRYLKKTNKKVAAIRKLKEMGKIENNKKWDDLSKEERVMVNKLSARL